ncbi:MAG: DNA-3-methyladenine glycosylase I [Pseudomonadota bacterium]|jgi:DNA-3-methyladenine glycosylase I|nr:DNA-3-methyladenine glycosylase I [Pseudomonadota bacterium]
MNKEIIRCGWCTGDPSYEAYHDEEWGVPIKRTQSLFRLLSLEGMQAGLSWITVLRKREAMESAFFGFDLERLATSGQNEIEVWLTNEGLIRHRGKLEALVNNARRTLEVENFAEFLWTFAPTDRPVYASLKSVPAQTEASSKMSTALKKLGYRFVGPTICYAFMQSAGMVNDHVTSCWRHGPCESLQLADSEHA